MKKRVTQAEFARICGVNRSTVSKWIKNQRIQADENGLIDPVAAAAMREATESPMPHHQARKAQFEEARTGKGINPPEKTPQIGDSGNRIVDVMLDEIRKGAVIDMRDGITKPINMPAENVAPPTITVENELSIEEIQKRTKIAVMRHQEASALDKENEAKRRAGELYERESVESAWVDALVTFRTTLETMPDRVAPAIARHRGDVAAIHHELSDAVVVLMQDLADGFRRRMSRDS